MDPNVAFKYHVQGLHHLIGFWVSVIVLSDWYYEVFHKFVDVITRLTPLIHFWIEKLVQAKDSELLYFLMFLKNERKIGNTTSVVVWSESLYVMFHISV